MKTKGKSQQTAVSSDMVFSSGQTYVKENYFHNL